MGGGRDKVQFNRFQKMRRAGLKRLVSPYGGNGETMSNFFRAFAGARFLRKTGNFRISRGLKKGAHVPSKSRFTTTEVETVLDYRSLDFLHFWWFGVIFAKVGIVKNKRHST